MAQTNESAQANPKKEEKLNQEETQSYVTKAVNGTKAAVGGAGSLIQSAAKAGGVWIVGGFIAMASAQYLGLGLIGTFVALAGIYLAVEGLKFIFAEEYSLKRKEMKAKLQDTKEKVLPKKNQTQAA